MKAKSISILILALAVLSPALHAQATLLLEEPYSYDGAFAGTGHAAVYLSRVCAASPVELRPCKPGERGIVISRYHGIAGYDWLAVPLIQYLYAVDNAEDVPLYADPKLVAFLRAQSLSKLKAALPPGAADPPNAPWYELAGSAYDRTLYGFQIATTPQQDAAFIRHWNDAPNREAYNLLKRNCADFVREVINFYYPKAVHRSIVEDLGVTTPKQTAKTLLHYGKHHRQIELTTFIIPQVAGMKRSRPIHGVLDSVLLAKKYMMPLLLLHPIMAGSVEAAYWAGWRFRLPKDAPIFDPVEGLQQPLQTEERRSYQRQLKAMKRDQLEGVPNPTDWPRLAAQAEPQLDSDGHPILQVKDEIGTVEIGLCRANILRTTAPPELVQQLLLVRLQHDLKAGDPARASAANVATDWRLLQQTLIDPMREVASEGHPVTPGK
jgi:hypothetical protein